MSDRASVVATTITQIVTGALRRWNAGDENALTNVRAEIAETLRDEFIDIERQILNDTRLNEPW
jgi:hypothetical protein